MVDSHNPQPTDGPIDDVDSAPAPDDKPTVRVHMHFSRATATCAGGLNTTRWWDEVGCPACLASRPEGEICDDPETAPKRVLGPPRRLPLPAQRFYPVAGLPRSGSTLLLNLLAQNPAFVATPTSGLIDLVKNARDGWTHNPNFQAEGIGACEPRIASALRGLIDGYHAADLAGDRLVFNKNRGWPQVLDVLDAVYGGPQRIILTLRDVRAVLASFEKLYRANPLKRHGFPAAAPIAVTAEGRARILLDPGNVVGAAINNVRDCVSRGPGRCVVVSYRRLADDPRAMLTALHGALGLAPFAYDPEHVEQKTHEDDGLHGWGDLHTIRGYVEPPTEVPWAGLYSDAFLAEVGAAYADIHALL